MVELLRLVFHELISTTFSTYNSKSLENNSCHRQSMKNDKVKSFRWACATLYNNINDCLSCIQVWCIEGNPTTRRIKVDSSYPGPGLLSFDWDDSKQSGHYESAINEVLSRCACTNLKNIPTHTMGWNIMQRRFFFTRFLIQFFHA